MSIPRVILVDVIPPNTPLRIAKRRITELEALTNTYGGMAIVRIIQKRRTPDYQTYVGKGKLEEVALLAREQDVDIIILNNALKPKQVFEVEEYARKTPMPEGREREKKLIQVWDRLDLILHIFSKHAQTVEAKLQIRLAAIRHMGPRIFGMGSEMMQQAGGIGTRGGGETNIEMMRRHLSNQERQLKKQLAACAQTRRLHRERRTRVGLQTVSIVGYTNAGKSSLLNALTHKGAYVANELFATLDTRVGKVWLPGDPVGREALLSDTIGFIQDLPPELVDAFRSTLEETVQADLILHVIDVTDVFRAEKIQEVEQILTQLELTDHPKLYVFNKIDGVKRVPRLTLQKRYAAFHPVFVSTRTGEGLEELKRVMFERLQEA